MRRGPSTENATLMNDGYGRPVMARGVEEEHVPATPAIGITLILLGLLLILGVLDLGTLLGVAGVVIGVLILLGEFA
jgi:hypothetical protein